MLTLQYLQCILLFPPLHSPLPWRSLVLYLPGQYTQCTNLLLPTTIKYTQTISIGSPSQAQLKHSLDTSRDLAPLKAPLLPCYPAISPTSALLVLLPPTQQLAPSTNPAPLELAVHSVHAIVLKALNLIPILHKLAMIPTCPATCILIHSQQVT